MKVAVFISGRGTNLQALIDVCNQDDPPAEIALVVSNRPNAQGLQRAAAAGIATVAIDHTTFDSREEFDRALDTAVRRAGCEFICLAGFMRVLTDDFMRDWRDRILGTHGREHQELVELSKCFVEVIGDRGRRNMRFLCQRLLDPARRRRFSADTHYRVRRESV